MADKAITDLNTIPGSVDDNNTWFAVAQSGTAYKVSGHEFTLALGAILDGHGGIKTIVYTPPVAPSLVGTMVITLADNSTTTVSINNGKGITSIAKTGTSGLVDTYTITYNDATTTTFSVTNGEKGDTGDSWYVWIRYAGSMPTSDADIGTTPDDWIGIYSGTSSTAPTHYTDYEWYEYKGEKGDTGADSEVTDQSVQYAQGDYANIAPSGGWSDTIPTVAQGKYLWTKTELVFNGDTQNPLVFYSVARMGIDGTGSVSSVNGISPDGTGNITVTASDIQASDNQSVQAHITSIESGIGNTALPTTAQTITGAIAEIDGDVSGKVSKSGDTMTGELTIERSGDVEYLKIKNTALAVSDTPSTNTYNSIVFTDKNDTVLGVVRLGYMTSGNHEIQLRASNGTANNDLYIRVKGDGTPDIGMTSSAAWRNTLGLGTSGALPITIAQGGTGQTEVIDISTISQIATAGTNISITEAFYDYWGKFAYLSMIVKANAAISSGATIATLVSGKRPRRAIYGQDSTNGLISIGASGAVQTQHTIASGNSITIRVTYLLP